MDVLFWEKEPQQNTFGVEVSLGPFWGYVGPMLGQCWANVGPMLGQYWANGVYVGLVLGHLVGCVRFHGSL